MKRFAAILLATALEAGCGLGEPPESEGTDSPVALQNVTVVDVTDGSLRPAQTVVIEGNRIAMIGPAADVDVGRGTRIVNGAGGYLIPGLWDMHAHAVEEQHVLTPVLKAYLASGVTGLRDPSTASLTLAAMIRPALQEGTILGPPRLLVAGNIIDGWPPSYPWTLVADSPERGREVVDSLAAAGAPFLKVYDRLTPDTYHAIVARANDLGIPVAGHVPNTIGVAEASAAGQASVEHMLDLAHDCSAGGDAARAELNAWLGYGVGTDSPPAVGAAMLRQVMAGAVSPFAEDQCRALLSRLADAGTWVVPTLVTTWKFTTATDSALAADPRTPYVPGWVRSFWGSHESDVRAAQAMIREQVPEIGNDVDPRTLSWHRARRVAGMLEEHDVPILVGSDAPAVSMVYPGFSVHEEMELLVDAGLSPLYVLQAATLNPARFLAWDDSLGTVEVGKLADLVLLEGNPLEDIGNVSRIRAVVANGRVHERADLDRLLEEVAAVSSRHSIANVLEGAMEEGGWEAARGSYLRLRDEAPDSVSFGIWDLSDFGHTLVAAGRLDEARTVFEWHIEAHPTSPYPHGSYAEALERIGRDEEAGEQWVAAVEVAERVSHPAVEYFRAQAR